VTRGYLGVSIQDVSKDIADSVGLPNARGAIVREPTEDGPAGAAGVKSGDIILKIDGDQIDDALDLSRTIAGKAPDSTVEVTIWRDGAETTLSVQLAQLEETAQAAPEAPVPPQALPEATTSLGMTLVPNGDGSGGLLVQNVDAGSVAGQRGISTGDVVLEVDNRVIQSAGDFDQAIAGVKDKGLNTALLKVSRNGEARFIGLPITE
jgi:serine protease Do